MDFSVRQNYDSDDDDNDNKFIYTGRDIVIFVIDASNSMFEKRPNEETNELESPFDICLGALDQVFRTKIRNGTKDLNGIVLYNTEKSPAPKDTVDSSVVAPAKCAVFMPLQKVDADMIRYVKNTKNSPDYNDFDNKYGHTGDTKISDVLWLCSSLISHCGHQVHSCTVFWLTNEDSPHQEGTSVYSEAMKGAKDAQYLQMHFELCPLKDEFDVSNFYGEFIGTVMNTDIHSIDLDYTLNEHDLKLKLLIHDSRCRALSYLTVEISEHSKFGIGVYSEISKIKEPRPVNIDKRTKALIRSHRAFKYAQLPINNDDDTDNIAEMSFNFDQKLGVEKAVKFLEIGGRKVKFTPLEVYEMKQLMTPKIKILGFKPLEAYNPLLHKRSGYFIHPSNKHIKNSSLMFHALWQTCLEKNKIILCVFSMRYKSFQQLAFMIPQRENEDSLQSDGFQLAFVPYSEEIRDISKHLVKEPCADGEVNSTMKKIISKSTINYDPMIFKNPISTKIYNKLEALEFDEEMEDFEDLAAPDAATLDRRIGPFVKILSDKFQTFEEVSKRKNQSKGENATKKVALDINFDMVYDLCKKKDTKTLNVDMLRGYLKHKNVSGLTKLKKDELIAKVVENP